MTQENIRLKRYALYLLGKRDYAVAKMRDKLMCQYKRSNKAVVDDSCQTGASCTTVVDQIIQYLISYNFLDDAKYARQYSASLARQGKSKRVIIQKLLNMGIAKDIVESEVVVDEQQQTQAIAHIIESHLRRTPDMLNTIQGRSKLTRHLAYRGFAYDDIRRQMERKAN